MRLLVNIVCLCFCVQAQAYISGGKQSIFASSGDELTPPTPAQIRQICAEFKQAYCTLQLATYYNYPDFVQTLLTEKVDINASDNQGKSALMEAINNGRTQIVKLLLENGAKVNQADESGQTAIHYLITSTNVELNQKIELIKQLKQYQPNLDAQNQNGNTALHLAVFDGKISLAQALLEQGANINSQNHQLATPLMLAVKSGGIRMLKMLLEYQPNLILTNDDKAQAMHIIEWSDYSPGDTVKTEIAKLLIEAGADINAQNGEAQSLLMLSLEHANLTLAKALIAQGANVKLADKDGYTALHYCAQSSGKMPSDASIQMAESLLKAGAELDALTNKHYSALHLSALRYKVGFAEFLLNTGADIHLKTDIGNNVIILTAISGSVEMTKMLLNKGASLTISNNNGMNALHYAALKSNTAMLKFLVSKGLQINQIDKLGNTPLILTAKNKYKLSSKAVEEASRYLIEAGANVNAANNAKKSALYYATAHANIRLIDLLLENEALINNQEGQLSPLEAATKRGDKALIKRLLKHQAIE